MPDSPAEPRSDPLRLCLISLGCSKNLVDSEVLLGHAVGEGMLVAQDPCDAELCVVNTCGFIDTAKEESLATLREVAALRDKGELKGLVVVGCLSERYGDALREEVPGIDAVLGLSDYSRVPALLRHLAQGGDERFLSDATGGARKSADSDRTRLLLTPKSYAYLRIGEGCDQTCSFCAIPSIRGKQRSKPIATLVDEAQGLAAAGVRELVLVAEDTTAYGMDRGRKRELPALLDALAEVDGIAWIRVLYAYPHTVRPELTERLRENPRVLPYLDIPIQHIAARMLRAMKRGVSSAQVRGILERLREEVPGIALRTTLITGFPGETSADFTELCTLVEDFRFERLGVFAYSPEEGTPAFELDGRIPEAVVAERVETLMELSRRNIEARNATLVGERLEVLVDGHLPAEAEGEGGSGSVARSFADAPEIDCRVLLDDALPSGSLVEVEVRQSLGFDLRASTIPA